MKAYLKRHWLGGAACLVLLVSACAVQITTPVEYNDQGTPIKWAPVETLKDEDD